MLTLLAALAVGITPDCDNLASPDWAVREAAEERLRAWGLLALPALCDVIRTSESAEARERGGRLLKPWRRLWADMRLIRTLNELSGRWECRWYTAEAVVVFSPDGTYTYGYGDRVTHIGRWSMVGREMTLTEHAIGSTHETIYTIRDFQRDGDSIVGIVDGRFPLTIWPQKQR